MTGVDPADPHLPRVIGPRVIGPVAGHPVDWEQPLLARVVARDAGALFELRERLGGPVFDRVRDLTGDRLVASLVTSGVFTWLWRSPADFAGRDLRRSLLAMAASRARQWLASTANPDATRLAAVTWPQARKNREDRDMPEQAAEGSDQLTDQLGDQLAVWWRLVDVLDELGVAWHETQDAAASAQIPADLAVALARSGAHGAEAAAGVVAMLARQIAGGGRFVQLADAARAVDDAWPRTVLHGGSECDPTTSRGRFDS